MNVCTIILFQVSIEVIASYITFEKALTLSLCCIFRKTFLKNSKKKKRKFKRCYYRVYRIGLNFFSILSSNLMKKVEIIKVFSQMETPIRTWRNHKSKILLHKKKVFLINFILVFYIFSVWISSFTSLNKGRKFPKRFLSFLCFGEF